jgi:prepilin-type N-terminal cleavage/methylation domain-containing protein/prepilin-type processing-associated H-X9-DG protein
MKRKGFTLIELLVVIAIIAILAAILFPVFAQAREKARAISCESNMKQIALGVIQYDQDYDENFPTQQNPGGNNNYDYQQTWVTSVQPYIKSYGVFACPDDPRTLPTQGQANYTGPKCSYVANAAMGYDWANSHGGGWELDGVINSGYGWANPNGIPKPRADGDVNFPASTIMLAEVWNYPAAGTPQLGAFSPYGVVLTGPNGTESPGGIPGWNAATNNCGAPQSNYGGLVPGGGLNKANPGHNGRANFAFVDGHVKSMLPLSTVDLNPVNNNNCNSAAAAERNPFLYMWSALRTTDTPQG